MTLSAARDVARQHGCEVVTRQFLDDVMKNGTRLAEAQENLRNLTALQLVANRPGLRGRLARRWIRKARRTWEMPW